MSTPLSPFDAAYAAYYDVLYADKNYVAEAEAIHTILTKHNVPTNGALLEMGCGSGIHAVEFLKQGYTLHGIDASAAMVSIAKERTKAFDNATFEATSIEDYTPTRTFDAVISLFHVVSYLTTNEQLHQLFNNVSKALKTNGVFVFDCWYGAGVLTDPPAVRTKHMHNTNYDVQRTATPELLPNENKVIVNFDVTVTNKNTNETHHITEAHHMRYLFTPEVQLLAQHYGLTLSEQSTFMSTEQPSTSTWYTMYVLSKM
ncbi:MAG: class I SAM-dependent methyltransferase [Bacteroidia bacterium]